MKIFLISLLVYLIPIIICHLISYILWINDKKSVGSTLIDLYNYVDDCTVFCLYVSWIPSINILLMLAMLINILVMLINIIVIKLRNLKIR